MAILKTTNQYEQTTKINSGPGVPGRDGSEKDSSLFSYSPLAQLRQANKVELLILLLFASKFASVLFSSAWTAVGAVESAVDPTTAPHDVR
ncbi:hypothetical protein PG984_012317 [Apiospora sp. TS-2023a]